jgi:hypothetical protein
MFCKECNKEIERKFTGKISKQGRKIYFDETKREWYGFKCPDCRYFVEKPVKKKKRIKRCKCKNILPKNRYFKCKDCQPALPSDDGDLVYFQVGEGD